MDELSLRTLFHSALDELAPPKPWLAATVREELRRRRHPARSRRGFRLLSPRFQRTVATTLVVLIAGAAVASAIALYRHTHVPVPIIHSPAGAAIRACGNDSGTITMLDRNNGWRGTERTTDGGKTWHDVSPTSPPPGSIKGGGAVCTLDPNLAWVIYGIGTAPYQPTQLRVMSTHDGGATWQQGGTVPIPWTVFWRTTFSTLLDFLDPQHGWLFMEYATKPLQRQVLATSDGGQTWSLVSQAPDLGLGDMAFDCAQTGLMFDTLRRGWLTWGCSQGFGDTPPSGSQVVATTNDGGRTWSPLRLNAIPTETGWNCNATPPIFTAANGVLQVGCSGQGRLAFIYSTADGGATWVQHPAPLAQQVDFVSGTTGFYFGSPGEAGPSTLYRTVDGGAHWTVVATGLFPNRSVGGLNFIDDLVGFITVSDSPAPWWTYDGGKTWSLPAPYRSAGSAVCDVFTDPGAGRQLPASVKMVSPTVGWAPGTRRSIDAGVDWTRVAPPDPKYRASGYGEFFLDADRAWVVDAVGTANACADRFVVYRTSDGGASWQRLSTTLVDGLPDATTLAGTWTLQVEFLDAHHGWLAVQPLAGFAGRQPGPVYTTADGGKTWSLVTQRSTWSSGDCTGAGLPLFSTPTTGWIADTCTGATRSSLNLLVTRDGGLTWANEEIAKSYCDATAYPNGCPLGGPLPQFFDANNGILMDLGSQVIFATSDGGATWSRRIFPRGTTFTCQGKYGPTTCNTQDVQDSSFITASEGWVVESELLPYGDNFNLIIEHTTDGGKTWTVVNRRTATIQSDAGEHFQFVDPKHGFWWFGSTVSWTADGGHTWSSAGVSYS